MKLMHATAHCIQLCNRLCSQIFFLLGELSVFQLCLNSELTHVTCAVDTFSRMGVTNSFFLFLPFVVSEQKSNKYSVYMSFVLKLQERVTNLMMTAFNQNACFGIKGSRRIPFVEWVRGLIRRVLLGI